MPLPAEAKSHHTVWIRFADGAARALRYAVDDDHLVVFGDRELADVVDGTRVGAAVHEIAGGPPLAEFAVTLREVDGDNVGVGALAELLDHVSLGRSTDEVAASFARHRARRLVALVP